MRRPLPAVGVADKVPKQQQPEMGISGKSCSSIGRQCQGTFGRGGWHSSSGGSNSSIMLVVSRVVGAAVASLLLLAAGCRDNRCSTIGKSCGCSHTSYISSRFFLDFFVLSLLLKGRAEDQTNDHTSRTLRRSTKSALSSGLYI